MMPKLSSLTSYSNNLLIMQNKANFTVCSVCSVTIDLVASLIFFMIYCHIWRLIFTDLKIEKESESHCKSNNLSKYLGKTF